MSQVAERGTPRGGLPGVGRVPHTEGRWNLKEQAGRTKSQGGTDPGSCW